jgi:hypothetical protein
LTFHLHPGLHHHREMIVVFIRFSEAFVDYPVHQLHGRGLQSPVPVVRIMSEARLAEPDAAHQYLFPSDDLIQQFLAHFGSRHGLRLRAEKSLRPPMEQVDFLERDLFDDRASKNRHKIECGPSSCSAPSMPPIFSASGSRIENAHLHRTSVIVHKRSEAV